MNDRQLALLNRLPRSHGTTRNDFRDTERKLQWYSYSDQDLAVIEKGVIEFEKVQEEKRIAKERKRAAIKAAKEKNKK